ncbi:MULTISPECIES: EAL domain-containing response regulator [unclassified Herbaspirillum]|jgi:EAL domain-containing protein (putative c-di-GMP-specific phosphodiesterase class I)/DNA-binding NarL/FixJ family response regulator|uniref:EAL domain-containing response regulator n=1 Tax=unclassified Herbaspirillum TaxID=2624150 RepID=UPI000E2EB976|nr:MULTISPECIES: EAL domain-containing response regulator [unclassified Herbaspirillum]RFB70712.1 EAL domain-containing protein [Herbaspirillum sp. 3R-3a1]TFI09150.1 EAL domain-containing protein [Herbaspirillum sp. 3R11]TFI15182.1 EAL domain-containing protein [Herbaspirillum sp. 3R-11]TFI24939.1 EAL domain-containing protein [Herbaspirillum sp. 3C11]
MTPFTIETLLIVDDSPLQRLHTVGLMRDLGVEMIYEAGDGQEALDLLALLKLPPSLVIVDLEMPGMDGVEFIQHLQERKLNFPIIVASSRETSLLASVETMIEALGMHVLGALQKPLNQEKILGALNSFNSNLAFPTKDDALPAVCETELASAIRNGEIIAFYQPKVDIRTGMLKGVEALARWMHPTNGMVPPDRFIPLAEKSGLIHELTLSMLTQAMAQAALWNDRGLPLKVAVNLSPLSLDIPGFVQKIVDLLAQHALQADQMVLEITEGSVVANLGMALGTLARLRLKGFGLSIDDYGTGFSSMQQLARIPFTELKIDRSFVHGAHARQNLRVILQSALDMARRLELVTVAEGIETIEDWRLLQESGCTIGQGYLIARPMPPNDLPVWLKGHHRRLGELRPPAAAAAIET